MRREMFLALMVVCLSLFFINIAISKEPISIEEKDIHPLKKLSADGKHLTVDGTVYSNGKYVPIELDENGEFESSLYNVSISSDSLILDYENEIVSLKFESIHAVNVLGIASEISTSEQSREINKNTYSSTFGSIFRSEYTIGTDFIKEDIIIDESIRWLDEGTDFILNYSVESSSGYSLVDHDLVFSENIKMPRMIVTDNKQESLRLDYEVNSNGFHVRIPSSWLLNAEYPVTIDPSLNLSGNTATICGNETYETVNISNGATLYFCYNTTKEPVMYVTDWMILEGSTISANQKGTVGGSSVTGICADAPAPYGGHHKCQENVGGSGCDISGDGAGGTGATNTVTQTGKAVKYGTGGGGGGVGCCTTLSSQSGQSGGGIIRIIGIENSDIKINGTITARGGNGGNGVSSITCLAGNCGGSGAGGGGASGGTVLIIGDSVNVSNSKFDVSGGSGGSASDTNCANDGNSGGAGATKIFSRTLSNDSVTATGDTNIFWGNEYSDPLTPSPAYDVTVAYNDTDLNCSSIVLDGNGGNLTAHFNLTVNGTHVAEMSLTEQLNGSQPSWLIHSDNYTVGEPVQCNISLHDGFVLSDTNSTSITISAFPYPVSLLTSPNNNTLSAIEKTFTCNATDGLGLSNTTLYVWNSTGSIINSSNYANLSGISGSASFNISFNYSDTYHWNCLVYNNHSNFRWNNTNFTLIVDITNPLVTMNYPADKKYLNNGSDIPFNCTVEGSNLDAVFLYGNFTGTYELNQTINNISDGVTNTFRLNLTDALYLWTCASNRTTDSTIIYSQLGNFSVIVDTVYPNITINYITTTGGSQTISFNSTAQDKNTMTCKYSIFDSDGNIDGINENVTFECNNVTYATVSAFASYNLTVYAVDPSGNENSSTSSFTVSEAVAPSVPSIGGGGGGAEIIISNITGKLDTKQIERIPFVYRQPREFTTIITANKNISVCSLNMTDYECTVDGSEMRLTIKIDIGNRFSKRIDDRLLVTFFDGEDLRANVILRVFNLGRYWSVNGGLASDFQKNNYWLFAVKDDKLVGIRLFPFIMLILAVLIFLYVRYRKKKSFRDFQNKFFFMLRLKKKKKI